MIILRQIVEMGHAKRKESAIKLRQPLASLKYSSEKQLSEDLEQILAEELNVKSVEYSKSSKDLSVRLDTNITQELAEEGTARDLIREIQKLRKEVNMTLNDKSKIIASSWPKSFEKLILAGTASVSIEKGEKLEVLKID